MDAFLFYYTNFEPFENELIVILQKMQLAVSPTSLEQAKE